MSERVIKFRAWHQQRRRMYSLVEFRCDENGVHPALVANSYDGPWFEVGNDVEMMQYTGLQDSQGQEIYEGDIVRINHPFDRTGDFTGSLGKVFWWPEEGGWYHTNSHDRPPKRMWQYVEVIGNVYEHSHLLEKNV